VANPCLDLPYCLILVARTDSAGESQCQTHRVSLALASTILQDLFALE
jgi:hypothetical protein